MNRHDRQSPLTMKIPGGEFLAGPSGESSYGGIGVSPVTDGQDARPTKTGLSPEDRHFQAEPEDEGILGGGFSGEYPPFSVGDRVVLVPVRASSRIPHVMRGALPSSPFPAQTSTPSYCLHLRQVVD